MPTYSYRCLECDNAFDIQQAFTDDTLTECPVCGGMLRKVFSPIGVSFTGSGFYRNDSREKAGKPGAAPDSGSESGSGSDSGSGSSESPGTETRPETSKPDAPKKDRPTKDAPKKESKPASTAAASPSKE